MPTPSVQYNGADVPLVKQVYFTGTTTLRKGQWLCYYAPSETVVVAWGTDVGVPTSTRAAYFAGWVTDGSAGTVGPGYIDIIVPQRGAVVTVEVDGTTDVAQGDELTLSTTSTLEGGKKNASTAFTDHPVLVAGAARTADSLGLLACFVKQD